MDTPPHGYDSYVVHKFILLTVTEHVLLSLITGKEKSKVSLGDVPNSLQLCISFVPQL